MITYDYKLAEHWICPLIYGDCSGLEDEEEKQLNDFLDSLPKHYYFKAPMHHHWDVQEEECEFTEDEISGLMANCASVKLIFI